ncbi:MAG: hypothetical protein IPK60_22085 [Sandaracinaceae bacterium]|jgi:uncharacterized protein YhbP (UPF0306 family)|nr:hypothetical protein [Sandaracinaceae bacterium]
MASRLVNKLAFEQRSRAGCSNSSYVFVRCSACSFYYVYDEELEELYFDPAKLTKWSASISQSAPCAGCGAASWKLIAATEVELPAIATAGWYFCISTTR